jgi:ligand-binding sensor domain-containing protein
MVRLSSDLRTGAGRQHHAGRLCRASLALVLVAALSANVAAQDKGPPAKSEPKADGKDQKPAVAKGEIVSEMAKDLWHVFQAKDGRHWFASRTEGAFRYDGKTITRFTKKDGLAGDDVGGIQEDKSGNIYFSTDQGISKFDGRSFTTLETKAAGEWKNQPDDLWFGGGQDSGVVYRYDGKSLHRLAFPRTKAGDDATLPRDKFPNAKYSPYDVYTIFKDSKGHLWFGTAVLGACRYDGKSFTWIPEEELQNGSFGTRSIIEDKDGKFWITNTLHRYAIDRGAAVGQGDKSQWYKKEKGIGDLSGRKQGEYDVFMSSTRGDDGAMWIAILDGMVWRYDGKTMTHYPVTENGKHHWIFSIYKDNQGVLWLGTQAHGAYRFSGKSFEKFRP